MRKRKNQEIEENPEYIILDENARVFSGLQCGYHVFSDNIDEAKPLQGQEKFDFMKRCMPHLKIEQMFLDTENVGKKRKHRKIKISI